jgi:hypothetical protein
MDEWERRRRQGRGATVAGFGVATTVALTVAFYLNGCGGKNEGTNQTVQLNQLASRLAGEWVALEDESNDKKSVKLHFTSGTNKLVYSYVERVKLPMQSRMDPPVYTGEERKQTRTYDIEKFTARSILLKKEPLGQVVIEFEFTSDNEFVAIYKCEWNNEPKVQGRFRRTVPRTPAPTPDASPLAQAKQQVQRIEQKLQKVEALQREAHQERDALVAKLRELGVESAADLKKNPRAQRTAENLAKLAAEIESTDAQLATIDTELLKARSIVRRMEREQAGISDDEMKKLSEQLREAEEKTDAAPKPITPLDVDTALNAALKGRKK